MVKKTGNSLVEITERIQPLSGTMEEIATASSEQATGVDELNRAIAQIDSSTQQNASTVEELASTAQSLSTESQTLASIVSRFKVSAIQHEPVKPKKASISQAIEASRKRKVPAAPVKAIQPQPLAQEDFEEF